VRLRGDLLDGGLSALLSGSLGHFGSLQD
jgi:hypothetical protein